MDVSVGDANSGSRKRKTTPNKSRQKRHTMPNFQDYEIKDCSHNKGKKSMFQCSEVTLENIEHCRNRIFASSNKIQQDIQICHHIIPSAPKRRRVKKSTPTKEHNLSIQYIIPNVCGGGFQRVCQNFFLSITRLSKSRVIKVASTLKRGAVPRETRGGDQTSHKLKTSKNEVRMFLRELRGQEIHYGRTKSKRIYLHSNLSIAKLYRTYKKSPQDIQCPKVSFSTFHRIFSTEFNIGFKSPAADACSMCERLKNSILRARNPIERNKFMFEKRIHTMKAKCFYTLMKEDVPNCKTYCFDLQQVQPLPKSADGDAFYLRQIGYYTMCIVETNTTNPVFYSWTEDQAGRGCTEIGSALTDFLNRIETDENFDNNIMHLRFFCRGCGGQNKNVIHALIYWLQNSKTKIETITITFPVRGHSFLPVHRVFDRIEKILTKEPLVKNKERYHELYKEVGNVRVLGKDWQLYDIKGLEKLFKNGPRISYMKRIVIKRFFEKGQAVIKCRYLSNYKFEHQDEFFKNLGKRGSSFKDFNLQELPIVRDLTPQKIDNVKKLLEGEFNSNWEADPELSWYKDLFSRSMNVLSETLNAGESDECDCLDEETNAIHI